MKRIVTQFLIIFAFIAHSMAQTKTLQFEDFFSVARVGTPVMAADGRWLAFTVKNARLSDNTSTTQIWISDRAGNNIRQVTNMTGSSTNPVFSPNGQYLYFLNKESGSMQIWRIDLKSEKSEQVTDVYGDIDAFVLSAQGSQFLLARRVPPDCPDESCIKNEGEKKKNDPVKARLIDQLMYRHWNEWLDGKYNHLFLYSQKNKNIEDLTPGTFHTPPIALGSSHDYTFSPDGNEICYVSNHDEMLAASTNNDIFIYSMSGRHATKISPGSGNDNNPHYSPDGKYIAYCSMERAGFESDRQRLMLYDRQKKEIKELTPGFTLSVEEILWSPDGREIYFTAQEKGNISIYKVALPSARIEGVLKGHDLKGICFLDENTLVFAKQSTQRPYEIFTYELDARQLKALTHFNDEFLAQFDLPAYEEFWFEGAQGDSVQGFIMKPPHFEPGKKYPAVHMIHGGPQGMWSNEWHFRWNYQMFATPGYAVYYINFHGSRGYGQRFTDSISRHWGDLPYEDLVKGTEYVLKHYDFVDPERLAAAGASYGGFMINWIAGHDNPYKCLVSHDGTYEQVSMWGATEELWFPEWEFGGLPWQKGSDYEKWSPSRLAANFKTPMLVIHSEHDYRVPYTQGLQLFSALQRQGVPSRLLFFPDEDHFVQKPLNAQLWWKTVYEWLAKYLKK